MDTFAVGLVVLAVILFSSNEAKYSGRLDNLDIDEILRNDRLLKNYFQCLMRRGPCTPEGSDLRRTIPDALKTQCEKCSESQKQKAARAIEYLIKNKPDMYAELEEKFDPENLYRKRIRDNLHLNETSLGETS